jgi:hypothetical protein
MWSVYVVLTMLPGNMYLTACPHTTSSIATNNCPNKLTPRSSSKLGITYFESHQPMNRSKQNDYHLNNKPIQQT